MSSGGNGGGGNASNKKKQGNLFSFFASKKNKKTTTPTPNGTSPSKPSSSPSAAAAASSASRGPRNTAQAADPIGDALYVGRRIAVYWPDDEEYYPALIRGKSRTSTTTCTLRYDDGDVETIDLKGEKYKFLDEKKGGSTNGQDGQGGSQGHEEEDEEKEGASSSPDSKGSAAANNTNSAAKKRRIVEESEEEFEFDEESSDGDDDDDGSAYVDGGDDEEDEDMDDFLADDDDEEEVGPRRSGKARTRKDGTGKAKKKSGGDKKKTVLRVTRVANPYDKSSNKKARVDNNNDHLTPPAPARRTANASGSNDEDDPTVSFFDSFANTAASTAATEASRARITPSPRPPPSSSSSSTMSPKALSPTPPRASTTAAPSSSTATTTQIKKAPPFAAGVLNPAGSHVHHHLTFLHPSKRRDAQRRPVSHPDYDPRTLHVDHNELARVQGSKLTPAQKQWWDVKSSGYADALLLFKTGKFYEIFHMDADVAVQVLGFQYMKGAAAHAGFPEVKYGVFAAKLVEAGYKVARVEQTETPEQLKKRKSECRRGEQKPMVVNREVCSVLTAGTRTFCYLDDVSGLESTTTGGIDGGGVGPLLAIKEILLDSNMTDAADGDAEEDDGPKPVCEYGITVVDAMRGVVTVGQFADDVLRSRMGTLLTTFGPSEVLVEGGTNGASPTLLSLLKAPPTGSSFRVETIRSKETFPASRAIDSSIRRQMERPSKNIQPWDVNECLDEVHRRGYYPRASRKAPQGRGAEGTGRWPEVLRACVQGGADLALSSFGAALFYLQRSLVDEEILGMGLVRAYVPPASGEGCGASAAASVGNSGGAEPSQSTTGSEELQRLAVLETRKEDGLDLVEDAAAGNSGGPSSRPNSSPPPVAFDSIDVGPDAASIAAEADIDHLALDGTTLANLEVLANAHSGTKEGSLWSRIDRTRSPHGSRLLRAWLLRPLFRKSDIDRRADAVEELASGGAAAAMSETRGVFSKMCDVERLLSRVHSMGGGASSSQSAGGHHPNDRAVLYEELAYTKRKVGDFSKLLHGLREASRVPDLFAGVDLRSPLLAKLVRTTDDGGVFPADMEEKLDWFFDNFDIKAAEQGMFEPARGMDENLDAAVDAIERIKRELDRYRDEMCSGVLRPSHQAKAAWKYINTKEDAKDKYLIELPVSVSVPDDFFVKGKRGKGAKQINKYSTPYVAGLVQELEQAIDVLKAGKARGMQLVFARFDAERPVWTAAAQVTAMLDALGALADTAAKPGYCRPTIVDCPPEGRPCISVVQGRHPCVDVTHSGSDFIPNDLSLGGCGDDHNRVGDSDDASRVLLLSGPNMGGKSTLLRQTCLIAILAQLGSFVPAESCSLTPIDRIFTRLGASDRILLGQSTFFVELAETAAALRGATRRSLVIMDELGRGTSTFDGTSIASAAVKHLVERNQCLTLFATHYHSLLEDWKEEKSVRLGHMECLVEGDNSSGNVEEKSNDHNITFLYTLGKGGCPKSFGINVARLAALPEEVLSKAKAVSTAFEAEMNGTGKQMKISPSTAIAMKKKIEAAIQQDDMDEVARLQGMLQ